MGRLAERPACGAAAGTRHVRGRAHAGTRAVPLLQRLRRWREADHSRQPQREAVWSGERRRSEHRGWVCSKNARVIRITRLRTRDGKPFITETISASQAQFPRPDRPPERSRYPLRPLPEGLWDARNANRRAHHRHRRRCENEPPKLKHRARHTAPQDRAHRLRARRPAGRMAVSLCHLHGAYYLGRRQSEGADLVRACLAARPRVCVAIEHGKDNGRRSLSLGGKTALVTGASSGLGRHFAHVSGRGRRQGGAGRAPARPAARRSQAEIRAEGGQAAAVALDVTDRASVAPRLRCGRGRAGAGDDPGQQRRRACRAPIS